MTRLLPVALFVALAACAVTGRHTRSAVSASPQRDGFIAGSGRAVAGSGRAVTPVRSAPPSPTVCVASWYGESLAGRPMANGDPFDPDLLTAAMWDVSFGTVLRVTEPTSGRTVDVTVTDRGPKRCLGRCVDLSREAFARIADLDAGLVHVTVEVVAVPEAAGPNGSGEGVAGTTRTPAGGGA